MKYRIQVRPTYYGGMPTKPSVTVKYKFLSDCIKFMQQNYNGTEWTVGEWAIGQEDNMGCRTDYLVEEMPPERKVQLEIERTFVNWYKDRDFPEVKSGNDDIVAVIPDMPQLLRVIESHNRLVEKNQDLAEKLKDAHEYIKGCVDILPDTEEGSNILAVRCKAAADRLTELEQEIGAIRTNNLENRDRS